MARLPLIIRQPWQCAGMLCILLLHTVQFLWLCLHARRRWPRETSSSGNNERCIRHAMPSPGELLMPRGSPWSGCHSGLTGNRLHGSATRNVQTAVPQVPSVVAAAIPHPDSHRSRWTCQRSSGRWRATIARGANGWADENPPNSSSMVILK